MVSIGYLNQVRERRLSPSPPPPESLTPPQRRLAREPPDHTGPGIERSVSWLNLEDAVLPAGYLSDTLLVFC